MKNLFIAIIILLFISKSKKKTNIGKSIIIGDSQSPYIANASKKAVLLGRPGSEKNLWLGGKGLNWLLAAVKKYPVSTEISNVIICIGTNGGFNPNDKIKELIIELKSKFPNSYLMVVKGSWGWGGNINKTESQVNAYYDIFKKYGVRVIKTPIGKIEPHGNFPVYKTIAAEIDNIIN